MKICFGINFVRPTLFSLLGKLISKANLLFRKTRKCAGKIQYLPHFKLKLNFCFAFLSFALSFVFPILLFFFFFVVFGFSLVFIHRANYALQCVSVAIVRTFRNEMSGFRRIHGRIHGNRVSSRT